MSDTQQKPRGLVTAHFVNSVSLLDERTSVAVGQTCISIQPATLTPEGDVVGIEKGTTPTGLLVRRKLVSGPEAGKVRRIWVPMANVRFCEVAE